MISKHVLNLTLHLYYFFDIIVSAFRHNSLVVFIFFTTILDILHLETQQQHISFLFVFIYTRGVLFGVFGNFWASSRRALAMLATLLFYFEQTFLSLYALLFFFVPHSSFFAWDDTLVSPSPVAYFLRIYFWVVYRQSTLLFVIFPFGFLLLFYRLGVHRITGSI